jgi:general secretion pathway protein I
MTAPRRSPEAGFTLIETLVALAILAASSVAFLNLTGAHVARVADLEKRSAAAWAGQNRLAELSLGVAPAEDVATVLGHTFRLDTEITETADPELRRVRVTVRDARTGAEITQVTGFLLAPDGGWGS